MKNFIYAICFLMATVAVGQDINKPNFVNPSPTASSLGTYGNVTTQLATGTSNTSIPLFSLNEQSINLSIALNYNYSGYKPAQTQSITGLGWNLMAGGLITRTVKGLADESPNGFLTTGSEITTINHNLRNIAEGNYDGEPDAFVFNFPGHSGEFFFCNDGQIHLKESTALKISFDNVANPHYPHSISNSGLSRFKIVDEKGNSYYFEDLEQSRSFSDVSEDVSTRNVISTWYLSRIIGVHGEIINFEYTYPDYNTTNLEFSISEKAHSVTGSNGGAAGRSSKYVYTKSHEAHLTAIIASNWEVRLEYSSQTLAVAPFVRSFKSLDRLILSDNNQQELKRFEITYSSERRHLIKSVQEKSGALSVKPYLMEYANENSSPGDVRAVDKWGYYNGVTNTTSMLEAYGANRNPNYSFARYFSLTKITYPTGGNTVIQYGSNTGSYKQGEPHTISKVVEEHYNFEWEVGANNQWQLNGTFPDVLVNATDTETHYRFEVWAHSTAFVDPICQQMSYRFIAPGTYNASFFIPDNACFNEMNTNEEDHCHVSLTVRRTVLQGKGDHQGQPFFFLGGVRVNAITHNPVDNPPTIIVYDYQDFENNIYSSGDISQDVYTTLDVYGSFNGTVSGSSPYNSMAASGFHYNNITEFKNAKVEKRYYLSGHNPVSNPTGGSDEYGFEIGAFPAVQFTDGPRVHGSYDSFDFLRGIPVKTIDYGNSLAKARIEEIFYLDKNSLLNSAGVYRADAISCDVLFTTPDPFAPSGFHYIVAAKFYNVSSVWPRVVMRYDSSFTHSGTPINSIKTEYFYTNLQHKQVSETHVSQSDGSKLKTVFRYPQDYTGGVHPSYQTMIDSNMVALPVETLFYKTGSGDDLFDASVITYQPVAGNARKSSLIVPYKVFKLALDEGSSLSPYSPLSVSSASGSYREALSYNQYNQLGNPLEIDFMQTTRNAYLWAYKGNRMVAQAENASYTALGSALAAIGQSFSSVLNLSDETTLKGHLDNLSSQSALSGAALTAQTFHPVYGLASLTLPDRSVQYFNYDKLGRLSRQKDIHQNITGHWRYRYFTASDKNHTIAYTPRTAVTDTNLIAGLTRYTYFDGLGATLQNVAKAESPLSKDIVLQATAYDNRRRPYRRFLPAPAATASGQYQSGVLALGQSFYGDNRPFSETTSYDNSALNRELNIYGAGQDWYSNLRFIANYDFPDDTGTRLYTVSAAGNITYGSYPAGSLLKKHQKDEQENVVYSFYDSEGRLIQTSNNNSITAYAYDPASRLRAVIQPEGYALNAPIAYDSENFRKYVFFYEYDKHGRVIRKHIPGAGWTEIVYDKADRPVMTQDAAQKVQNRWNFTQYDAFGREIASGKTVKTTTRAAAQSLFNSQAVVYESWTDHGYSELSFPTALKPAPVEIEKYNFYDNYGFIASEFAYKPSGAFHTPKSSAKGLLTGVSKRNSADDNRYYTDIYYYDDLNRIIQSQHTHQKSTGNQQNVIVVNKEYNFSNEVTKEHTTYPMPTGTVYTAQHNFYDHAGRMIRIDFGISTAAAPGFGSAHPAGGTTEAKGGMYSLGFSQPNSGVNEGGADGWVNGADGWVSGAEPTSGFTTPTLSKLITYSYDEIGRMTEKRFMPDGTFSLGNPDYIYLPPSPTGTTENKARKAVILEPGTLIDASVTGVYQAGIDSTVSDIPPFSSLQRQRYSWHIRGGLRGINLNPAGNAIPDLTKGDLFSYKLDYESAGQWNGNIGRQSWNHVNGTTAVGVRNYLFNYDLKNQLKTATYSGLPGENYSIPNINYDRNSNITSLQRMGKMGGTFGLMDNLTYTYSGNRLTAVNDAVSGDHEVDFVKRGAGAYTYWENGALKSDENEQITNITYNTFLNQPEQVTLSDGRWIKHTYDGSGTLIKTEYSTGEYWESASGMIFKNGTFYQMAIPEGRAIYEGGAWKPEFDYKDHLGNTRVSFKADGNRLVHTAKTDTDPWGVILKTGQENSFQNRHEMQGHEREKTFGLNRVNFGARTYNPTIARFDRVDRYSEKYAPLSTYQYAGNNPIRYIDINGDSLWIAHKGNNYLYNDGQLFNSDGSQFDGKMKGFLKQTVNALGQLNATAEGTALVSELQNSTNNFTIKDGNNSFVSSSSSKAGANLSEVQAVTGNTVGSSGSGGTIYWNANSSSGGIDLKGGTSRPAYVALGHEMAHASDANQGLLHFGNMGSQPMSFTNHQGTVYNYQYNGLLKSEWRAVYRENLIRGQAKLPLRTYYGYDMTTGTPQPTGPRLLDSKNLPINYP